VVVLIIDQHRVGSFKGKRKSPVVVHLNGIVSSQIAFQAMEGGAEFSGEVVIDAGSSPA
jgi:hypothetical protein